MPIQFLTSNSNVLNSVDQLEAIRILMVYIYVNVRPIHNILTNYFHHNYVDQLKALKIHIEYEVDLDAHYDNGWKPIHNILY